MKNNKNKHMSKTTPKAKENNTSTQINLQLSITREGQVRYRNPQIIIFDENSIPQIKLTSEVDKDHIQASLPFSITWKNEKLKGTFVATLTKNNEVEEWGIKWENRSPNFGVLEDYIYEEIEEKLLEIILKEYNAHQNQDSKPSETKTT
jgi:hypothetical protein